MAQERSKAVLRPLSSKAPRPAVPALSFTAVDSRPSSLSSPRARSSQPASPTQVLRQALRAAANSPKNTDAGEQENRPPPSFVFPDTSSSKPPRSPKSLAQSPSAMSLSQKVVLRSDFPRTSSQRDLKPDLSKVVTQVRLDKPLTSDRLYQEHLFNTFQAVKFIRSLKPVDPVQLAAKAVLLPRLQYPRKTVVFDLDETLVHCVEDVARAHIAVPITFPTGERLIAGVNIRPYARECLAAVSSFCEVVVFTASQRCYADQVLDYLDPSRTAISLRLYRDSCVTTDGVYIKDLRILGNRRLQDIVIVDNAAYSFGYQLDNGVPIIGWYEDPQDRELYNLVDYLRSATLAEDIRPVNKETFHLYRFYEDYLRDCKRLN